VNDITLIGLGKMGTALAEAWLKGHHRITVWNRNATRCDALAANGADVAATVVAAVEASDVVAFSLSDYRAMDAVLRRDEVIPCLRNKTVIQLSSGTPREARDAAAWFEKVGATYLDGAILGYPMHVALGLATVLISGPKDAFDQNQGLLQALGAVRYLGENPGAASALDCAVLTMYMLNIVGLVHGIAICESESVDPSELVAIINAQLPVFGELNRSILASIRDRVFSNPQASLDTWAAVATHLSQISSDNQLSQAVPSMLMTIFEQARRQGLGESDIASIVEVIRAGGREPGDYAGDRV
jgi:3-hydroxyisobutyrate dehydrogenase-like beta-hydroxyacid dehydrogenase